MIKRKNNGADYQSGLLAPQVHRPGMAVRNDYEQARMEAASKRSLIDE